MKLPEFPSHRIMKTGRLVVALCVSALAGGVPFHLLATPARPLPLHVIAWDGSTPEAEKLLRFSGIRQGCSDPPESCMKAAAIAARRGTRKVFISMVLKPETISYGVRYSELSKGNPFVEEVGLDDFVGQYFELWKMQGPKSPAMLDALISSLKSINPNLHFGVTLYEDDLARFREYLSDPRLPASIRNKVDYVHFYCHYRAGSENYLEYLNRAKDAFPRAQVIAGVYAYDRIDYLPCAPDSSPCSPQQEMDGFNRELDTAITLLRNGTASWIEFYPGYFGREARWTGWDNRRICSPERKHGCIERTIRMHSIVAGKLNQFK
jgi:hypothetical protein